MSVFDALCDHVLIPIGGVVKQAVEGTGSAIDSVAQTVVIDGVCGGLDTVVETIVENPGKTAAVAVAGVLSGGVAYAAAGPIAATIGGMGVLGSTSAGVPIFTLTGAALESASLAALGGGALAAGGGGVAAGTTVVATGGAVIGGAGATVVASQSS